MLKKSKPQKEMTAVQLERQIYALENKLKQLKKQLSDRKQFEFEAR